MIDESFVNTKQEEESRNRAIPLIVDLDGTLIKSDLLVESCLALLKSNPLYVLLLPLWLVRGKAYLKHQIAERVEVDAELLPYHSTFLEYLRMEAGRGRELILATATNERLASQVAEHLGIFQKVLASTAQTNLSGKQKLEAIMKVCGESKFDYAGNAPADLWIWSHANAAILVNTKSSVKKAVQKSGNLKSVFNEGSTGIVVYMKAIRMHQWLKNSLLFVPLLTSHQWHNISLLFNATIGFLAFSLCASSVYLFNDLLDLPSDRNHPQKAKRPFASGDIPLQHGLLLSPFLLFSGFVVSFYLSFEFQCILFGYLTLSLAYSFFFKKIVLTDIIILASLYTMRVIAGAFAVGVILSFWLLALSMFQFLSLALIKRTTELITYSNLGRQSASGRGYRVSDLHYLISMGTASGFVAILVLALYINSSDVVKLYTHPAMLWLLCPLLLSYISRLWLKVVRHEMDEDPLSFSITDPVSLLIVALITLVTLLAV